MSVCARRNVKCPKCGETQEELVWSSINVTVDPNLRAKLARGEINFCKCHHCGSTCHMNTPLLYHDMALRFCVQYYPEDHLDDINFLRSFKSDGSPVQDAGLVSILDQPQFAYLSNPHIVFDIVDMLNYVRFREGICRASKE